MSDETTTTLPDKPKKAAAKAGLDRKVRHLGTFVDFRKRAWPAYLEFQDSDEPKERGFAVLCVGTHKEFKPGLRVLELAQLKALKVEFKPSGKTEAGDKAKAKPVNKKKHHAAVLAAAGPGGAGAGPAPPVGGRPARRQALRLDRDQGGRIREADRGGHGAPGRRLAVHHRRHPAHGSRRQAHAGADLLSAAAPKTLRGQALRDKIRTTRGWAADRILHQKPWPKQIEIAAAVMDSPIRRTAVSGCVGSTKTYALAMLALEWLMAHKPGRVFSLAPSFRQVDANLWGYIKKLWNDAKAGGTPIGDDRDIFHVPKIQFHDPATGKAIPGWYYEGFSTDEPGNVHGLHGDHDLVILDDAQGLSKELMDEIENIMAGKGTRIVMAFNKMVLHGPTYDCLHADRAAWNHVGISFADLQAARAQGFQLDGALGEDTESRWRKKYGPKSNFYKVKVLNQYPSQENDTLIPLEWIELAFDRKVPSAGDLVLGGDVASEGDDNNALAPMRGRMVGDVEVWQEPDTMVTVGRFVAAAKAEEHHEDNGVQKSKAFLYVDSCGLGGPMVNRIAEQTNRSEEHSRHCVGCQAPIKVQGLNGAEKPQGRFLDGNKVKDATDVFTNLRSQMYWNLREKLNPANPPATLIGLTRNSDLSAQLSAIKWRTNSAGKKEVEPKIGLSVAKGGSANWGIKRRLGYSPDQADAVCYAVWGSERPAGGSHTAPVEGKAGRIAESSSDFQTAEADSGVFMDGMQEGSGLDGVD